MPTRAARSPAERQARYRERRILGLRPITIDVASTTISELARFELIPASVLDDKVLTAEALGLLLEEIAERKKM